MTMRAAAFLCTALALAACATVNSDFQEGRSLVERGELDRGFALVRKAVSEDPTSAEYRIYLASQQAYYSLQATMQAEKALAHGEFDEAARRYRRALEIEPGNERAATGLAGIDRRRQDQALVKEARTRLTAGDVTQAQAMAREVLDRDPRQAQARALLEGIERARAAREKPAQLGAAYDRPIDIEFRDTTLRAAFEILARTTGINFVFDRDVRSDTRTTLFVHDARVRDIVTMLLKTNQLAGKVLNANTLLVYPDTPAKLKDYQHLVVRSFYLGNADAKQSLAMLRAVLKTRDIYVDDKLNMLVMRDTPEAVAAAAKLIAAQDLPEPEVVLDVEVLEVKRSRLLELGIQWPNQLTALNIVPNPTTTTTTGGVVVTTENTTSTTSLLTLDTLRNLTASQIAVSPNPQLNVRDDSTDVNLLANPQIRVKNREKAHIHIGDRVPVITTTSTANVGVSESVSYLDVGLKLDVEPVVHLDQDVQIKIGLEVSSIVNEVRSSTGTLTYQLGTRNASTTLRVHDGEPQILAGLISDEDRRSASRVPGLGSLPVLDHLFGTTSSDGTKTEIILLITPHVVRNIMPGVGYEAQFDAGTEAAPGAAPLAIALGARLAVAPAAGTAPRAGSVPQQGEPDRAEPQEPEPEHAPPQPAAVAPPPAPAAPPAARER
jgi:general secretion pathway protein D